MLDYSCIFNHISLYCPFSKFSVLLHRNIIDLGEIEHMLIHPTSKIGAWVLLCHPTLLLFSFLIIL